MVEKFRIEGCKSDQRLVPLIEAVNEIIDVVNDLSLKVKEIKKWIKRANHDLARHRRLD